MDRVSLGHDPAVAELYRDAIHHQLIVLGEAVNALSDAVRDRDPQIPWAPIVGLRNRLSHEYFRIDAEMIRAVVRTDLPDLVTRARSLIAALDR